MNVGRVKALIQVECGKCHFKDNYLYPKSLRADGDCTVNCNQCAGTFIGLNLKRPVDLEDFLSEYNQINEGYFSGKDVGEVEKRVDEIALRYEERNPCVCGGQYTVAAKPRC